MKKFFALLSLLALVTLPSCKKDHCYKCTPPPGCIPSTVPCVPPPYAVGLEITPGIPVLQAGSFFFEATVFYINTNVPFTDTCGLNFTIGGQSYLSQFPVFYAPDTADLANFSGGIAFDTTGFKGFNSVTLGYHLHQRCDCDSSRFNASFAFTYVPPSTIATNPNTILVSIAKAINSNGKFAKLNNGHLFIANSPDMLGKIMKTHVSNERFSFQKYLKK